MPEAYTIRVLNGRTNGARLPKLNVSELMCGAAAPASGCGLVLAASPEAPGKSRRAFVDAALAPDKVPQWLIQVFEFRRIPQNAGPFAPRPIINLCWISRTINDGRERFWLS
jgi:hypothetical protein